MKPKETKGLKALSVGLDRLVITFAGRTGLDHDISIPSAAIGPLIAALTKAAEHFAKATQKEGQDMGMSHAFTTKRATVGIDAAGQNVGLSLTSQDDIELQFLLLREQAQRLAQDIERALFPAGPGQPTSTSSKMQ